MTALRKLLSLKPGFQTSEFWAHAIVSVISLLVAIGLLPVGLPNADQTWVQLGAFGAAALCTGLYALSRGKVKAGASSLVTMLDHAVGALLTGTNPVAGQALLNKVLPELEGLVPGASGDITKLVSLVKEHSEWLEDLESKLRALSSPLQQVITPTMPLSATTSSGVVINAPSTVDLASSTSEPADGTTTSGDGGWPSGTATDPVNPVVTVDTPAADSAASTATVPPAAAPF